MNTPMISVIMPVYNAEKYLEEAIDSILNQTYKNFEFIIINDGSMDKSEEVILSYDDSRIVYVKNEQNIQIVKTLNKGLALAQGRYIARMDADDVSLSERFEKQLQFMKKNDDIAVCGTWVQTFGTREQIWKYPLSHEEIKISLLFNSALAHPSVMIKKDFFNNFQYEEQYNKAEDYALWVKAIEKQKFSNMPFPLLKYRLHAEQTDAKSQDEVADETRKMMLKKFHHDLNHDEITMYMKIISNEYLPLVDLKLIFNKLVERNKESNFFKQSLFRRLLRLKFLTSISMNTNGCLQTFYRFQNLFMHIFLFFSSPRYLKLLIKCLIGNMDLKWKGFEK